MVRLAGFEPAPSGSASQRSIQVSYRREIGAARGTRTRNQETRKLLLIHLSFRRRTVCNGAKGETRTLTPRRAAGFEPAASTISPLSQLLPQTWCDWRDSNSHAISGTDPSSQRVYHSTTIALTSRRPPPSEVPLLSGPVRETRTLTPLRAPASETGASTIPP